ncbi:APC family permease [Allofournierella sp.]|uniref:APC family permease n=1 Tax=Allofournierella sp. TaxID=1940256 RepID=UPI003AB84214
MQEKKKINLWQTILFSICGILVLDSIASPAMIGVSAITMWVITAIVFFIPYGLVNAELGSTYPDDGGIASWVQRAFGEKHAVLVGWYYWVNVAFWMPAVFVAFSSWFSMAFAPSASPWLLAAIAIVMCWLVVAIGIRGVDLSVAVSNIAAFCKVAIVVIMGVLGVVYGVTRGFANDFSLHAFIPDMSHATEYIAIIVYNLLGFELISSVGGDIENPKKNIPKMTVFAGLIVTVLYIMGTFGILAAIPVDGISEADGFFYAIQELCSVFGPAQNAVFYVLIIVAMLTLVSNMVSWSMGAVETLGAIGMEERSPKLLGHKHKKFGTNDYSYIVMGVISTVLVVVNFSLSGDANDVFWNIFAFSTLVFMLPYLWLFPAAWKLRKSDPGTERVYKAPALGLCVVLGEACMAVAVFFLFYVPFDPLYHGMLIVGTIITTLIGFKLYNNGKKANK